MPAVIVRFLLNMYTGHRTHVLWNSCESRWFNVCNGVKQGGVLSPVLFCVYIDGLLISLHRAGLGCHIGHMFVGVLAYADDLVLLAPTPMPCALCYSVVNSTPRSKLMMCYSMLISQHA